ncbi:MAG: hypothetical protein KF729_22515 [Sandaracinaceae bacterium]|nr:hypothetical protein [Sandaracinaceae bacterium]
MTPKHRALLLAPLVLALASAAAPARAQPRGVLLSPRLRGTDVEGVGHALDRVLHAQLREHGVLELAATPALGIEDLQLAVGCVADSRDCFTAVATQLEVAVLVFLDVERAGSELVLTLSVYESGADEVRAVTRRVGGEGAEARALDEVDPMVRQVFGLPPPPEGAGDGVAPARRAAGTSERADEPPIVPLVLLGAGAVALGVAVGLGVASQDTLSSYERLTVASPADVDAALALYDRAETEALAANVLFGVAAALAAGGAVAWIIMAATAGEGGDVAVAPAAGPDFAGVVVAGRFGGAR